MKNLTIKTVLIFLISLSGYYSEAQNKPSLESKKLSETEKTFSLYSIGNSHTWDFRPGYDFLEIAKSLNINIKNGWHINCGQNLDKIWNNPEQTCVDLTEFGAYKNALKNYKFDAITIQTYIGGTAKAEMEAIEKFLNFIANSINKNSDIYIYCTWPKDTAKQLANFNYSEAWLSDFDENDTLKIISKLSEKLV